MGGRGHGGQLLFTTEGTEGTENGLQTDGGDPADRGLRGRATLPSYGDVGVTPPAAIHRVVPFCRLTATSE